MTSCIEPPNQILRKSLTVLFSTKDLSLVKQYLQRQWRKIEEGRVSLQGKSGLC
jgi:DNA polymerase zeta